MALWDKDFTITDEERDEINKMNDFNSDIFDANEENDSFEKNMEAYNKRITTFMEKYSDDFKNVENENIYRERRIAAAKIIGLVKHKPSQYNLGKDKTSLTFDLCYDRWCRVDIYSPKKIDIEETGMDNVDHGTYDSPELAAEKINELFKNYKTQVEEKNIRTAEVNLYGEKVKIVLPYNGENK